MTTQTKPCSFCGSPFPRSERIHESRWAARLYCSHSCRAKAIANGRKTSDARCVCELPLRPGEKLCALCRLEGLSPTEEKPGRRIRPLTANPDEEGYVLLLSSWFKKPHSSHPYPLPAARRSWLDELLDEIAPMEEKVDA